MRILYFASALVIAPPAMLCLFVVFGGAVVIARLIASLLFVMSLNF